MMRSICSKNAMKRAIVWSTMLGVLGLLAPLCRPQPGRFPQDRPTEASITHADFAVADFDGDRKPDLATVEMENGASTGDARYYIRFRLATGDTQVFGVTAPAGGLQVVATDVNGDNAVDLLVSTAWRHERVAVFLNDGHGNFTPVRPEAFPVVSSVEMYWELRPSPCGDTAALLRFVSCVQGEPEQSRSGRSPRQIGIAQADLFLQRSELFLFSLLGRAPPVLQA
jgi:hypothetical protein